jgi:hypothetical protein
MSLSHILHHGPISGVEGFCYKLLVDAANSLLMAAYSKAQKPSPDGKAGVGRDFIEFSLDGIALVSTHVHMDHAGLDTCLLAAGFRGQAVAQLVPTIEAVNWEMSEAAQVRML